MNLIGDMFDKILKVLLTDMEEDNRPVRRVLGKEIRQRNPGVSKCSARVESHIGDLPSKTANKKEIVTSRTKNTETPLKQINKCKKIENTFTPKQLVIKLQKDVPKGSEEVKDIVRPKQLFVKLTSLENQAQNTSGNNCKIQLQKVTFKEGTKTENALHTLRRLQPKNYLEESFPIYRKAWSEEHKSKTQPKDVYEFSDICPTPKHINRKSSILFDKETHEIMQRLEKKEARGRKRLVKKKNNLMKKKTYEVIISNIVSNVAQKIKKKTDAVKTVRDNTINQQATSSKIIDLNDLSDQINITVHNFSGVPASSQNPVPNTSNVVPPIKITNISHIEDPILFQSIRSCDNSISQRDIDNCFGFDEIPPTSTPDKPRDKNFKINVISNVVLRPGNEDVESPIEFTRRPNANSTMVHQRLPSPWRTNWTSVRNNPHFVSTKQNALPRIEQEMVLNHTFVQSFESACSFRQAPQTPRKTLVQQNILDFVNSNIEKDREVVPSSLYDYEAFNSPEKKTDMSKVQEVKRSVLGASSTPNKRKPLADISNFSEETVPHNAENLTYFGFDVSSRISPIKSKKNDENSPENSPAKPSRFDVDQLRSYSKKRNEPLEQAGMDIIESQDESVSLIEASTDESFGEVCLFEEPEEMLDKMSPVSLHLKKRQRKRLDSCDSDHEKRKKKRKKTKLEIEQEAWIRDFNEMCEEIDEHELEIE